MKAEILRGSWIITLPLGAVVAVYVVAVFLPNSHAVAEARLQIRQQQECLAQSTGLAGEVLAAQQELSEAQAYLAAWDRRAPGPGHRSLLHGKIYALAKAAGVTTTRFDPEPIEQRAAICEIPITLGFSGSFGQICDFLESLEREPVETWIPFVKIERIERGRDSVACEISLVIFAGNLEISDYAKGSR